MLQRQVVLKIEQSAKVFECLIQQYLQFNKAIIIFFFVLGMAVRA